VCAQKQSSLEILTMDAVDQLSLNTKTTQLKPNNVRNEHILLQWIMSGYH
jgi:hypothetical protein